MTDAADNPELLSLRYVDIDTLSAWDRNAKKHDFGALVESIVRHGFRDPPSYDSALNNGAGGVSEGNGRADALRMMRAQQMQLPRYMMEQDGQWFAPVLFGADSESQAAAEAYAVAHNNLTMAGGDFTDLDMSKMWDSVGYAELLASLAEQGESPVTIDESALDALLAVLSDENTGEQTLAELWEGMPEFDQENQKSWRKLIVHFDNQADFDAFTRAIGQTLTSQTKYIWYPHREKMNLKVYSVVTDES